MGEVFEDGTYTVYSEKIDEIKPGDIIYLTTSEFEYDCVYGCFMNGIRGSADVEVEIMNEDLSEYNPDKCKNGGCHGFAAAKVLKIMDAVGAYVFDDEDVKHSVQTTLM